MEVWIDLLDYGQSLLHPGQTNSMSGGGEAAAAGIDLWHSNCTYGGCDGEVELQLPASCTE